VGVFVVVTVLDELKDAIQNDIKIATVKLDSPPFSKYSKDSFFAPLEAQP